MVPTLRDPVRHALRYPFARAARSYRLTRSGPVALPDGAARELDPGGRTAALAVGANAAPGVLAAKLAGRLGPEGLPVLFGQARGLAVVYSAHLTRYGSVPATPLHCPGARCEAFVLLLTEAQRAALDGTEALGVNYRRAPVEGVTVRPEGGAAIPCDAYLSLHGPLLLDGAPVAVAAVPQAGVPWPRRTQVRVQEAARRRAGFSGPLFDFIRANVADPAARARHAAALKGAEGDAG